MSVSPPALRRASRRRRGCGTTLLIATTCAAVLGRTPATGQETYIHHNADGSISFSNAPTEPGYESHDLPGTTRPQAPTPRKQSKPAGPARPESTAPPSGEEAAERQLRDEVQLRVEIDHLHSPKAASRQRAAEALQHLPLARRAIPELVRAAASEDAATRAAATVALYRIAPDDPGALQAIDNGFKDSAENVRTQVANLMMRSGAAAVPLVRRALRHPELGSRLAAAHAIEEGKLGQHDATLIPEAATAFAAVLASDDPNMRRTAAYGLGRLGPAAREAAPALLSVLSDKDVYVRAAAAGALGEIGADPATVIPALAKLLTQPYHVADAARTALNRIGTPEAKAALEGH
jgi:HEAT repeat protein